MHIAAGHKRKVETFATANTPYEHDPKKGSKRVSRDTSTTGLSCLSIPDQVGLTNPEKGESVIPRAGERCSKR
jgi:hypothetical protein